MLEGYGGDHLGKYGARGSSSRSLELGTLLCVDQMFFKGSLHN